MKDQLNLEQDFMDDDIFLSRAITTARIQCEEFCNRYFAEISVLFLFPASQNVYLPPDTAIQSITDMNGNSIADFTHDEDFNTVSFDSYHEYLKVLVTTGKSYPQVETAISMLVSDMYENRTAEYVKRNMAVESLLYPLRFNLGM